MIAKANTFREHTDEDEKKWIKEATTDPGAFQPLYNSYFKRIYLFVYHRVGEKDISADITQQVFINALTHIAGYRIQAVPFSAWLFRIAINECNQFFRKTKRERLVILEEEHIENLYEELTNQEAFDKWKDMLPNILERLPNTSLQLIELRFFERRTFREIAEILNISENNAKVKTYRVLNHMKKLYLQK